MKVLVNNSLYKMERKEYKGVLKVASQQILCGIYAVEKMVSANCGKTPLTAKRN